MLPHRTAIRLQEFPERVNRQPSILDDSTHGVRVDWIVPGDSQDPNAVRHYNMLALS